MGLDTSHDAWHGSYGAFSRWRDHLAEVAGYESAVLKDDYRSTILIDWGHITDKSLYGEWDQTPADPLIVLIAHSDCEGVIHPEQAKPLANRLEELLPGLDEGESGGHIWSMREVTERFIEGLRAAADAGEDLDFH